MVPILAACGMWRYFCGLLFCGTANAANPLPIEKSLSAWVLTAYWQVGSVGRRAFVMWGCSGIVGCLVSRLRTCTHLHTRLHRI